MKTQRNTQLKLVKQLLVRKQTLYVLTQGQARIPDQTSFNC